MSVLLNGCTTWTLTKHPEERLDYISYNDNHCTMCASRSNRLSSHKLVGFTIFDLKFFSESFSTQFVCYVFVKSKWKEFSVENKLYQV